MLACLTSKLISKLAYNGSMFYEIPEFYCNDINVNSFLDFFKLKVIIAPPQC